MQDEKYKVKYGKNEENSPVQKVLLTLSCGVSSLVLVDVMTSLLKEQFDMHKGKQGFELVLLNINEYELKALDRSVKDVLEQIGSTFQAN